MPAALVDRSSMDGTCPLCTCSTARLGLSFPTRFETVIFPVRDFPLGLPLGLLSPAVENFHSVVHYFFFFWLLCLIATVPVLDFYRWFLHHFGWSVASMVVGVGCLLFD